MDGKRSWKAILICAAVVVVVKLGFKYVLKGVIRDSSGRAVGAAAPTTPGEARRRELLVRGAIDVGCEALPPLRTGPPANDAGAAFRAIESVVPAAELPTFWAVRWSFLAECEGTIEFEIVDRPGTVVGDLPASEQGRSLARRGTNLIPMGLRTNDDGQKLLLGGKSVTFTERVTRIPPDAAPPAYMWPGYDDRAAARPLMVGAARQDVVPDPELGLLVPLGPVRSQPALRIVPPATPDADRCLDVAVIGAADPARPSGPGRPWRALAPGGWHVLRCSWWKADPTDADRLLRLDPADACLVDPSGADRRRLADLAEPLWIVRCRFVPKPAEPSPK